MLIQFKAKNYKSFKEEFILDMKPTTLKDIDYSVLKKEISGKEIKALSSAVIYGPNAAGKTNIIEAMADFKTIILTGKISNIAESTAIRTSSRTNGQWELMPTVSSKEDEPTVFGIEFTADNKLIKYELSLLLGGFINPSYKRKIIKESLHINNKEIFERTSSNIAINYNNIESFLNDKMINIEKNKNNISEIARNSLSDTELFLANGFKLVYNTNIIKVFEETLRKNFQVIVKGDKINAIPERPSNNKNIELGMPMFIKECIQQVSPASNIVYHWDKETQVPALLSLISEKHQALPADRFESKGTVRLINILSVIYDILVGGRVLVIDEFDASIHPMIIMNIINLFHNDEININGAQLIFNTHNPIFLNTSLFRRDEIKFVDSNEDLKTSELYALSDFGTNGDIPVRKTTDYVKNYFLNKYGGIKNIDLYDIFKDEVENAQSK